MLRIYGGVEMLNRGVKFLTWVGRPPTKPKSEADLVVEAKQDQEPTLNSAFSACFGLALWRRYWRHLQAERDPRNQEVVLFMLFWGPAWEGLALATACIVGFLYLNLLNSGIVTADNIIVSVTCGLTIGACAIWYRANVKMYNRVYADLYITRNPDAREPWQAEQKMTAKAVRLAFKDRMDSVFYGSYASGYIRLETQEDISEWTAMKQVIESRTVTQELGEAPLVDGHSRMTEFEQSGLEIHNDRKRSLGEQLAQNFGFIAGVIFAVVGFYCLVQMQDGELLGRPDVEERHALIDRLEAERQSREAALLEEAAR